MMINLDNYESWFLDYLEGNLDPGQMEMVRLFRIEHPDLAVETDELSPFLKADADLVYPGKNLLKKEEFDDPVHFEQSAIAAMEGDMREEELNQFQIWINKNPDRQKFVKEFEQCRLVPDKKIIFPGKNRLKKKSIWMSGWTQAAAVAAIALLTLLTFIPESRKTQSTSTQIVETSLPKRRDKAPEAEAAGNKSLPAQPEKKQRKVEAAPKRVLKKQDVKVEHLGTLEPRYAENIQKLEPRSGKLEPPPPLFVDLLTILEQKALYASSMEMPLSEYLKDKYQELKTNDPSEFITREEFTIAGLHLFSRLPGKRLTGRKGSDGRLKTISFSTQLLAFSIPVNR
ncbi:MAG: hypothetical protein M0Q53_04925 [Prolixibacteraceae bacterium]|jgi:hypothetical protein|nr:hypothetical protein [Prolixibacteraceae bacterium]